MAQAVNGQRRDRRHVGCELIVVREESAFTGKPTDEGQTGPVVETSAHKSKRIPVLDGWRATSILLVLGAHLLPLGPKSLQLNFVAGASGMALFFTLSGFLIVSFLAGGMRVTDFLARRLARILPLCWTAVAILLVWHRYDVVTIIRNFLFIANLPPATLLEGGQHLWSLGVEMQFYMSVAVICLLFGRRGLYLVPVLAFLVTALRIIQQQPISIVTWHRIDEILAGGIIALLWAGWFGSKALEALKRLPVWPLGVLLIICSHPDSGPMMYLRPYAAAFLVGASLGNCPPRLKRLLVSKPMAYVAEVSYALYVIHGMLAASWLGTGDRLDRYLKKPLLFGATFLLAHVSTRYFEQPITRAVRRMTSSGRAKRPPAGLASPQPSSSTLG
jgi:peptidoglycan/LPS O-acetylase OafA/YrhL